MEADKKQNKQRRGPEETTWRRAKNRNEYQIVTAGKDKTKVIHAHRHALFNPWATVEAFSTLNPRKP